MLRVLGEHGMLGDKVEAGSRFSPDAPPCLDHWLVPNSVGRLTDPLTGQEQMLSGHFGWAVE